MSCTGRSRCALSPAARQRSVHTAHSRAAFLHHHTHAAAPPMSAARLGRGPHCFLLMQRAPGRRRSGACLTAPARPCCVGTPTRCVYLWFADAREFPAGVVCATQDLCRWFPYAHVRRAGSGRKKSLGPAFRMPALGERSLPHTSAVAREAPGRNAERLGWGGAPGAFRGGT